MDDIISVTDSLNKFDQSSPEADSTQMANIMNHDDAPAYQNSDERRRSVSFSGSHAEGAHDPVNGYSEPSNSTTQANESFASSGHGSNPSENGFSMNGFDWKTPVAIDVHHDASANNQNNTQRSRFGPKDIVLGFRYYHEFLPPANKIFEERIRSFLKECVTSYCQKFDSAGLKSASIKVRSTQKKRDHSCLGTFEDLYMALGISIDRNMFHAEHRYFAAIKGKLSKKSYYTTKFEEISEISKLKDKLRSMLGSRIKEAAAEYENELDQQEMPHQVCEDGNAHKKVKVAHPSVGLVDFAKKIKEKQDCVNEILKKIDGFKTVLDFKLAASASAGPVGTAVGRLIEAQAAQTSGIEDNEEREARIVEWSKQLMIDLRGAHPKVDASLETKQVTAFSLDCDRKVCLELLYVLVRRINNEAFPSFTTKSLDEFQHRNIKRILGVCLPMDRAKCLYYNYYEPKQCYGQAWYSQKDVEKSQFWREIDSKYKHGQHGPTINKKTVQLIETLDLKEHARWIQPMLAPWMEEDHKQGPAIV